MKQRNEPYWSLLPVWFWIVIFVSALIFMALFCWLATVYHWYAVVVPDTTFDWAQYSALAAESFVFSLIAMSALSIGLKRMRLTSVPWYMQGDFLRSIIGFALLILLVLDGIGSVSSSIIVVVGQAVCLLTVITSFVWMFIAPTKKYQQKKYEQVKDVE